MSDDRTLAPPRTRVRAVAGIQEHYNRKQGNKQGTTALTFLFLLGLAGVAAAYLLFPQFIPQSRAALIRMRLLPIALLLCSALGTWELLILRRMQRRTSRQKRLVAALRTRFARGDSIVDPLTGLFTRHFGEEQLAREIAHASRCRHALTLLLLDLDDFTELNRRHGRGAGNQALQLFARELKKAIRNSDIPARAGGDEFLVILPECHRYSVPTTLGRLHDVAVTVGDEEVLLGFAAGWAELQPGESAEELLRRAMENLESDKRTGVSQVEAQRAAAEAERGGKLQALGQLTSQVAHDFNNLLAIIRGYSDMALNNLNGNEAARVKVTQIARVAEQASELVAHLRAFTRNSPPQWNVVDLNDRMQDVMALLQPLLGERVALAVSTGQRSPVRAQAGQLEQILVNLVMNARDALRGEGAISVHVRHLLLDEEFASARPGLHTGRHVAVTVRDNGNGMDEATRARVFQPYFTTKPNGTGLGLATVSDLVRDMGGFIEVESTLGEGATFSFYLPLAEDAAVADSELVARETYAIRVAGCGRAAAAGVAMRGVAAATMLGKRP